MYLVSCCIMYRVIIHCIILPCAMLYYVVSGLISFVHCSAQCLVSVLPFFLLQFKLLSYFLHFFGILNPFAIAKSITCTIFYTHTFRCNFNKLITVSIIITLPRIFSISVFIINLCNLFNSSTDFGVIKIIYYCISYSSLNISLIIEINITI